MANLKDVVEKQYGKKGRELKNLSVGSVVKVNTKIKEGNKERVQAYEGVLIAKKGSGLDAMFTVRKISFGAIGVERTFPINSPMIDSIEILRQGKAKRAKLFYLREAFGRKARREIMRFDKDASKEDLKKINDEIEQERIVELAKKAEEAKAAAEIKKKEDDAKAAEEAVKKAEEAKIAKAAAEEKKKAEEAKAAEEAKVAASAEAEAPVEEPKTEETAAPVEAPAEEVKAEEKPSEEPKKEEEKKD